MSERPAVRVAVSVPIRHLLTYAVPDELVSKVMPGQHIRVPVGPRKVPGFVVDFDFSPKTGPLKDIDAILDPIPALTPVTLELGLWVARYYGACPGEALQAVVPAPVRHRTARKEERVFSLPDRDAALRWIEAHGATKAALPRVRVLTALLASEDTVSLQSLLTTAKVSASPLETLVKAGLVATRRVPVFDDPLNALRTKPDVPPTLTDDQARALELLLPLLDQPKSRTTLLHGVTGSGKTEVYLRLLERNLANGRGAILLVPEIALTPQTVERLLARLPGLAVLHSNLSLGDRAEQWRRLQAGEVRIAVGPRSAIFAPLENVGLIIIDEEHETTFKQNQSPRYHTRDVAMRRAEIEGSLLVLGSATPSLETLAGVHDGSILCADLPKRVAGRALPECEVIDMRAQKPVGPGGILSRKLYLMLEETLDRKEQALLFLNRRGFSTSVLCRVCGFKAKCKSCDINLTHYRRTARLLCHYCGEESQPPTQCPDCANLGLLFEGVGTEKVAAAAKKLFPGAVVARADAETLRPRGAPERLYHALKSGKIDIVVGTQVVAKGLDIPAISLVGVVSADTALLVPDFRSSERTFQLLCQVAGRAGRGDRPGRVLIQTFCPDHFAIQTAAQHDGLRFSRQELKTRESLGYPPSGSLLRVVVEAEKEDKGLELATQIGKDLRERDAIKDGHLEVLGPAPCPLPLLRDHYRFHLLIRTQSAERLTELLDTFNPKAPAHTRIHIDRDPVQVL